MRDDDDAQVDGESPPFATTLHGSPWNAALPPWHMWGNSQRVRITTQGFGAGRVVTHQLLKVAYKRPETWHWLFHTVLFEGPTPGTPQEAGFRVDFDVTLGHGRSVVKLPSFETFSRHWADIPPTPASRTPPLNQPIWSTSAFAPQRRATVFTPYPPEFDRLNQVDQLVAQDIQVEVRIDCGFGAGTNFPATFELEVSAFLAPKTHVRPDWFQDGEPQRVFAGEEIAGR